MPTTTSAPTSRESVYGACPGAPRRDTEPDVFETRGGDDWITSGAAGVAEPGRHRDGRGARHRHLLRAPPAAPSTTARIPTSSCSSDNVGGRLAVDNVTRRATIGDGTVLTWTAVDTFAMRAARRGGLLRRLRRGRVDQHLNGWSTTWPHRPRSRPAAATTASGCRPICPPASISETATTRSTYAACHRAYVALDVSAECLTIDGREVSTALAGIESSTASTAGRPHRAREPSGPTGDRRARYVLVRSGPRRRPRACLRGPDSAGGGRPRHRPAQGRRRPGA